LQLLDQTGTQRRRLHLDFLLQEKLLLLATLCQLMKKHLLLL
jgi:hypothetical protein